MADQQPENKSTLEEQKVPPADEAEEETVPKAGSPVPPVAKANTPELTESPEMVAAMAVELTTARTETDALVEAIKEVSSSVENEEGQEGTSKLIKVMLLGLKAQRSISQGGCIEMKQIAVKQLDLLRHVASGFSDQTDLLQQISDDIGANLNKLAQSFVKLSDVIKDGHTRSKDGGNDIENRHRQLLEKLDSQNVYFLHIRNGVNGLVKELKNLQWTAEELRTGGKEGKSGEVSSKAGSLIATVNRNSAEILERYPVDLAAMTDEITKSVKSLEGIMKEGLEKKRPAEGPPPGTEMERDQKMAQWWAEIAAVSAKSGSVTMNPGQPMPPPGLAPPSGTPMTPVSGDGSMPIPSYGFPPPLPPGYYYGPPPNLPAPTGMTPAPTGMTAPAMPPRRVHLREECWRSL
eukprot:symbB.v1.2.040191.t1/scaffold7061.1/size13543/1